MTEYLWCNYPAPMALHDYRYLGKDFRERERIKRMTRGGSTGYRLCRYCKGKRCKRPWRKLTTA